MALHENGDIFKATVTISLPSLVEAQNVFYWELRDENLGTWEDSWILDRIPGALDDFYTELLSRIANDVEIMDVNIDKVEWQTDKWVVVDTLGTVDLSLNGSNATDATPHGVAATLTCETDQPKSRGRKFIPGIAENDFTDSTASGALLTALTAALAVWLSDIGLSGVAVLVPGIVSVGLVGAGNFYEFTAGIVNSIAGYQRRRKPGVGS
jgi:hypothetical protein